MLNPRHIEVQVLADGYGNVVHLGERECSLQRRHQKVIEEAPSPLLDADTRARIGAAACDTARSVDYVGAGTVEFIVSADRPDEFFFMEMNTRLQVEHPVTEMVTGSTWSNCRCASPPARSCRSPRTTSPWLGTPSRPASTRRIPGVAFCPPAERCSTSWMPVGQGIRVDSGLAPGTVIGSEYDPMLAKVIAHAGDRSAALRALDRALADTAVLGVTTNIEFLRFLLADSDVVAGRLDTGLLDRRIADFAPAQPGDDELIAAAAYKWLRSWPATGADLWAVPSGWRLGERAPTTIRLHDRRAHRPRLPHRHTGCRVGDGRRR